MDKPWHEMTPAERLASRIAKNREIDRRVAETVAAAQSKAESPVAGRTRAVRSALDKFQQIKRTQGIDAASEFVRDQKA
jgi:hypothetical protein